MDGGVKRPSAETMAEWRAGANAIGYRDIGLRNVVLGLFAEIDALTAERDEARKLVRSAARLNTEDGHDYYADVAIDSSEAVDRWEYDRLSAEVKRLQDTGALPSQLTEEERINWAWGNLMASTNHKPTRTYEEFREMCRKTTEGT